MIVYTDTIQTNVCIVHTTFEVLVVFLVECCPCNFSQCNGTRICAIFANVVSIHIFWPCIGLYTKNMMCLAHSNQCVRHRIVTINFFQSRVSTDSYRLNLRITLKCVNIHTIASRSHNYIVRLECWSDTTLFTTPWHHCSVRTQTTFKNFIPTDNLLTILGQHFFHATDDIALEAFFRSMSVLCLQTELLDECLTIRTFLPATLRTFITTDMIIFTWEDFDHFLNNIFKEIKHISLTRTHYKIFHTPNNTWCYFFACTGEVRISCNGSQFMTRSFKFRNNGNEAFCSVCYHFLHFFLSVEATMSCSFTFLTGSTHFCKFRILLYFHTPALVFSQVPVEGVDLQHRHYINLTLYFFNGHEMTTWVTHQTAIGETRSIFNRYTRQWPFGIDNRFAFNFSRKQLKNSLHTIEQTSRSFGCNEDIVRSHFQFVSFFIYFHIRVNTQNDVTF